MWRLSYLTCYDGVDLKSKTLRAVGAVVASEIRYPKFESSHWQTFFVFLNRNCKDETKIKERPTEWPIQDLWEALPLCLIRRPNDWLIRNDKKTSQLFIFLFTPCLFKLINAYTEQHRPSAKDLGITQVVVVVLVLFHLSHFLLKRN